MNWHWPAGKYSNFLPWYQIIRRIIFVPIWAVLRIIVVVVAFLGWGIDEAKEFWNKMA